MEDNVVFTTIHGSRLYGFSHAGSDYDRFTVFSDDRRARHSVSGELDHVRMGISRFLELAEGGSHQSVEALFSPVKEWGSSAWMFRSMLEGMVITGSEVFAKYERTIKAFAHGDFKRRRHAVRLWLNLKELREHGLIASVRLDYHSINWATFVANTYEGDNLLRVLGMKE